MSDKQPRSKLLIPVLLALLFIGPFVTAIVMYYYGGDNWRPRGSVAHGALIEPPPSLGNEPVLLPDGTRTAFVGKWSLLYTGSGNCTSGCQQALWQLRQVRQALEDRHRAHRPTVGSAAARRSWASAARV